MLEAKQIRSEKRITTAVHQQRTLPISQIQSLIRAGADPEHIARQYELSEVIVRRFATSIEAEKKYAIEQFLRVRAPKESKVRTLSEVPLTAPWRPHGCGPRNRCNGRRRGGVWNRGASAPPSSRRGIGSTPNGRGTCTTTPWCASTTPRAS